ncbi:MAG TPA: hypothetical protein VJQ82_00410 [Terriglobales bacterium]|nr:hypothetical protein [Terriglobales bacterium]
MTTTKHRARRMRLYNSAVMHDGERQNEYRCGSCLAKMWVPVNIKWYAWCNGEKQYLVYHAVITAPAPPKKGATK